MIQPLVSVIIPTYNRKTYVQQAIDSVLAQTYPHYEIIVIDDGSTDGTGEALAARYGDRITYHWQENQGESAARNWGIRLAKGEYIALLDSDDIWYPRKLEAQLAWCEERIDIGFVTCLGESIDSNGDILPTLNYGLKGKDREQTYEELYRDYMVGNTSCVLVVRQTLEEVGGFDESIRFGEDEDLFLRVAAISKFGYVPEVLVSMRIHSGGQWYFPKPERTSAVLHDHLKIIEKGYQLWPDKPSYAAEVRDRRMAWEHGTAAIQYFAFDEIQQGRGSLRRAEVLDSDFWTDFCSVKPQVLMLIRAIEENKAIAHINGTKVVERVIEQLWLMGVKGIDDPVEAIAQLLMEMGYQFSKDGERAKALRYLTGAIRLDARHIRDRGVQLELIKNSLGNSTAQRVRDTYRLVRNRTRSST